ncbi:hypothetical protein PS627_02560 [Pseudomonas fluorescens]|uniref:DUF2790 domain-containing protein n=1 Tax=Pseudomonas fluorescens TaxID=294 RepID=UPI001258CF9F|nr:DUF2790 domain-containing protein [Pseudomonas fluorescens]CAG8867579.1 hypothetical protein PS627_02560 [Pseudomonas fluorescens]VVP91702.1 hypothetical protein PS910_02935 [Pseudomonas fluorescens]
MKPLLILALLGLSPFALADEPAAASQPVVQQYDYSVNLDIKRVISLSTIPDVCEVVPATMTYEDHQGQIHVLQYRAMGQGCEEG